MQATITVTPAQLPELLLHVAVVRPVFLWGAPGIGKSSLVREFADSLGLECVTLLGTQLAPEDLIGVPADRRRPQPVRPPESIARDEPYCLFLDELNAATPEVQKAFYSLILDRRIGAYELPDGLHRHRRRQPGHRQRARPADGLRAGQPPDPRPPAGLRRRLAELGRPSNGIHPWILDYLAAAARPPVVPRRRRPRSRSPRRAPGTCSPTRCTPTATTLDDETLEVLAFGTLDRRARLRVLRLRQDRAARATASTPSSRATRRWPRRPEDRDLLYFLAESFRGPAGQGAARRPRQHVPPKRARPAASAPSRCSSSWPRSPLEVRPARHRRRRRRRARAARLVPGRGRPGPAPAGGGAVVSQARSKARSRPVARRRSLQGLAGRRPAPRCSAASTARAARGGRGAMLRPRHAGRSSTPDGDVYVHPTRRAEPGSGPGSSRTACCTSASATSIRARARRRTSTTTARPPRTAPPAAWPSTASCARSSSARCPEPLPADLPATATRSTLAERWRSAGVPAAYDSRMRRARLPHRHGRDWPRPSTASCAFAIGVAAAATDGVDAAGGTPRRPRPTGHATGPWERALSWFVSSYPLLGALAAGITIVADAELARALGHLGRRGQRRGRRDLRQPAAPITAEEWRFVLAHEMLHAALRHGDRGRHARPVPVERRLRLRHQRLAGRDGRRRRCPTGCCTTRTLQGCPPRRSTTASPATCAACASSPPCAARGLGDVLGAPARPAPRDYVDLDEFYRRALRTGLACHQRHGPRLRCPAGLVAGDPGARPAAAALGRPARPLVRRVRAPPEEPRRSYARALPPPGRPPRTSRAPGWYFRPEEIAALHLRRRPRHLRLDGPHAARQGARRDRLLRRGPRRAAPPASCSATRPRTTRATCRSRRSRAGSGCAAAAARSSSRASTCWSAPTTSRRTRRSWSSPTASATCCASAASTRS